MDPVSLATVALMMPLSRVQEVPLSLTVTAVAGGAGCAFRRANGATIAMQAKATRHAWRVGRDVLMADSSQVRRIEQTYLRDAADVLIIPIRIESVGRWQGEPHHMRPNAS